MGKRSWRRGKDLARTDFSAAEEAGFYPAGNERPVKDFKQE